MRQIGNSVFDFGTIEKGSEGIAKFEFKNILDIDASVTVELSCGCLESKVHYKGVIIDINSMIPPSEKITVTVKYDTSNIGYFNKVGSLTYYSGSTKIKKGSLLFTLTGTVK